MEGYVFTGGSTPDLWSSGLWSFLGVPLASGSWSFGGGTPVRPVAKGDTTEQDKGYFPQDRTGVPQDRTGVPPG